VSCILVVPHFLWFRTHQLSLTQQDSPAIPVLRRQRQEDRVQGQFEVHRRDCLKEQSHTLMVEKCFLMWIVFIFSIFIFWQYWGLNSGAHTCLAGILPHEPVSQLCFVLSFFYIGSLELIAGLSLNHDPPDFCLLWRVARTTDVANVTHL
jgi:hypothetical protein